LVCGKKIKKQFSQVDGIPDSSMPVGPRFNNILRVFSELDIFHGTPLQKKSWFYVLNFNCLWEIAVFAETLRPSSFTLYVMAGFHTSKTQKLLASALRLFFLSPTEAVQDAVKLKEFLPETLSSEERKRYEYLWTGFN
jgi:hypothetical protein